MDDDVTTAGRTRVVSYHPPARDRTELFGASGLDRLRAIDAGTVHGPPIGEFVDLRFVSIDDGDVIMSATPDESHYNAIGSVHGGFFATVLDSACGCAVHSTLPAGTGFTTLELKVSFLKPVSAETGVVFAHGWVTRRGRSAVFVEADLRDISGRVLATASSTCLLFDANTIPIVPSGC